jgi:DNA-binding transcriptional LysR family regulator
MELRDLEYFAVIAEHLHLRRAADSIGLTQPALSKSLQRLEAILQVRLFNRSPKGLELTAEGSLLLLRVRELRQSLRNVGREISEVSDGRSGQLRIGAGWPVSERLLSNSAAALLKDAPRVKLQVTISDGDQLFPALQRGDLDVLVSYFRPAEGLVSEHLYDDEFVVCASADHELANSKKVTLAELAKYRWALSEPTLMSQRWLLDRFQEAGLTAPQIVFESRSLWIKQHIVARSNLLTFTTRAVIEQFASTSAVKIIAARQLAWPYPVAAIYRKESFVPPLLRRFIQVARKEAQRIGAELD